jgi:recombination protein RecT
MATLATRPPDAGGNKSQIISLLSRPDIKEQMALALPSHVTAERLARIALTEVRKNPKLLNCDQVSFMGAIMQCCQLGLEPGGALGHAYLIPFENRAKGIIECQFIVGYRGMIDLARRSGQIVSLSARVVHLGDQFRFCYGLNETIEHVPGPDAGPMTHVYAVAKLKDGGQQFEVMTRADVEEIRNNSHGYKSAVKYGKKDHPWMTNFEEMARKTVNRRLFKSLPVSIELSTAVSLDEQADRGGQENPLAHLTLAAPAQQPSLPAAATTSVPPLSEQQLQTIRRAAELRLNPVGRRAFEVLCGELATIPADRFGDVIATLQDDATVNQLNAGRGPDGDLLIEEAEIEAIIGAATVAPAEPPPAAAEPAPPTADATPIRRRVGAA